ncbi:basic phospholipase A2 homolog LmutTX-like [Anomaloglossus baeobatrachus]|uniref:basic phospholipase A2 homolog LmutTX-like n=1 Tax=Anomaloglossus baeobatrachus TaxID=238106 RepID=UPI003F4F9A38
MLSSLLLLLSLVSVKGARINRKDFMMMISETLKKEMIEALPRGCACAETANNKTMQKLKRCCHEHYCCYISRLGSPCRNEFHRYSYTYSNGTITCDHSVYLNDCAITTCECDRETVMCLMDPEDSESKYSESCSRKFQPCSKFTKWMSSYRKNVKKINPQ